jgi:hypothetical protein
VTTIPSPVDLLLGELRDQLAPAAIELACALAAMGGWTTAPYTFARFEEWCDRSGISRGHARMVLFLDMHPSVQDELWRGLAERCRNPALDSPLATDRRKE